MCQLAQVISSPGSRRRQFEALETRESGVDRLLARAGTCIQVGPALRAQTLAVLLAEGGVGDGEYELFAEQGLELDVLALVGEQIEVTGGDLLALFGVRIVDRHLSL